MQPILDRILVKRIEPDETSKGGILIPVTSRDKPQEGEIIATGEGMVNNQGEIIPLELKTGDRILFAKNTGIEVNIDDKQYLVMKEQDVLAVLG